jgi:4-aminobutyrate aminotransferase-like enzyme
VNPIGRRIIRMLPPLIAKKEHVDTAVRVLGEALEAEA